MRPELFDILNKMPSGVLAKLRMRGGSAAAPLVEDDDAIGLWIVQPPHYRTASRTRSAVNQHGRFSSRIAALLEIDLVQIGNLESSGPVGLVLRIQRSALGHDFRLSPGSWAGDIEVQRAICQDRGASGIHRIGELQ